MLEETNSTKTRQHIPAWLLLLTVFISGGSVLIIELIGTRVLAPYFGSGIYTWSALISVTLAALALGYALGGKYVDKYPKPVLLFHLCLIAGLWTALTPSMAGLLLPNFVHLIDVRVGVLLSSLLLFAPNLFVLGMACPFAIRLFARDLNASGTTSGLVFSISTLGSLLGALGAGFILVPNYGVLNILTFCSLLLFLLATSGYIYLKHFSMCAFSVVVAAISTYGLLPASPPQYSSLELLDSSPSFYGHAQVVSKDGFKILLVDGVGQNYVNKNGDSEITYINFMSTLPLVRHKTDTTPLNSLVIGLGAGQLPMLLKKAGLKVTAVEIDPVIDTMARKYFDFDIEKANVHIADGRLFLSKSNNKYDYIFIDAFNSDQIAGHLLSRQALELSRSHLNEFGQLAINITSIASGLDIASLHTTLESVFPYVRAFNENSRNELTSIVFLASSSPILLQVNNTELTTTQSANIKQYLAGELNDIDGGLVLDDDFNPVSHQRLQTQLLWRKEMRDFLGEDYYYLAFL